MLRSTIVRAPITRSVFRPAQPRRFPPGLRRVLLWLLLAALLVALVLVAWDRANNPQSLAESALAGPRKVNGAVCVEEAVDISGSMGAFREQREAAERALFTFAQRELHPDDRFSAAFFAGSAGLGLPPTPMSALASAPSVPPGIAFDGTRLAPAVRTLVQARPADDGCAARALIVITDGEIFDNPQALSDALTSAGYTRVFAVIPTAAGFSRPDALPESIDVLHFHGGGLWGEVVSLFSDAQPLDVVFGEVLAEVTGQQLVQNRGGDS